MKYGSEYTHGRHKMSKSHLTESILYGYICSQNRFYQDIFKTFQNVVFCTLYVENII